MICSACGGVFADDAEKCPYCGTIHLAGATEAYNEKVEEINDDLAELADDAAEAYEQTIHSHSKRALKIFIIAGTIIACFAIALSVWVYVANHNEAAKTKKQLAWEQTTFPTLDAWYEQGEYDEILAFYRNHLESEDSDFTLYSWDHYDFLSTYRDYNDYLEVKALMEAGERVPNYRLVWLLCVCLELYDSSEYSTYGISAQDQALILGYQQEISIFMQSVLDVTEADLEAFAETEHEKNGWVSYEACEEFINAHP